MFILMIDQHAFPNSLVIDYTTSVCGASRLARFRLYLPLNISMFKEIER